MDLYLCLYCISEVWVQCFHFYWVLKCFKISSLFLSWLIFHSIVSCSISKCLYTFYCLYYCWYRSLIHSDQKDAGYWWLVCLQVFGQFWIEFHELLRRMYIIPCLGKMFSKFLSFDSTLFSPSISLFSWVFFCMSCLLSRETLSLNEGQIGDFYS